MKPLARTFWGFATNRPTAIRRGIFALVLLAGSWSWGPRQTGVMAQTGHASEQAAANPTTNEPWPPAYYPPGQQPDGNRPCQPAATDPRSASGAVTTERSIANEQRSGTENATADLQNAATISGLAPGNASKFAPKVPAPAAPAPAHTAQLPVVQLGIADDTLDGQPPANVTFMPGPTAMEIRPRDAWPRPRRLDSAEPIQAAILNHFVESQPGPTQVDAPSTWLPDIAPKQVEHVNSLPPLDRPPYVDQQSNAVLKMAQAPTALIGPETLAPQAPGKPPGPPVSAPPVAARGGSMLAGTVPPTEVGDGLHGTNSCANAPFDDHVFIPDPDYLCLPYNAQAQLGIYAGKFCVPAQAPWVELWRGLYQAGPLPPAGTFLTGETNPIIPHFLVFGDFRSAIAYNDNGPDDREFGVWANRLNLDFDLKITSTERIHAFWGPLDEDGRFTRAEFRDDDIELKEEFDDDFDTLFLEGDLGYIWGGMTDRWAPFDLPFVAGKYPLLFQNGI